MPTCPTNLHDSVPPSTQLSCGNCSQRRFLLAQGKLICEECGKPSGYIAAEPFLRELHELRAMQSTYKDTLCRALEGVVPILEACAEAVPQYKFSIAQYTIALRGHILELKRK